MAEEFIAASRSIHGQRYENAEVVFLAGSLVRGEGTSTSDLDLVVVFKRLENAWRESFLFEGRPVEAFVHDPQTLEFFFQRDRQGGIPVLLTMVSEGIEIPGSTEFSRRMKEIANRMISEGPPPWTKADLDASRYAISNMIDDLRDPRSRSEQSASGVELYAILANHYLRSRGLWAAKGKAIPRQLRRVDAVFAESFETGFEALFRHGESRKLIELAEVVLAHDGGRLFDGYLASAPSDWRTP